MARTDYVYRDVNGLHGGIVIEESDSSGDRLERILGVVKVLRYARIFDDRALCLYCREKAKGTPREMRAWARSHYCPEAP